MDTMDSSADTEPGFRVPASYAAAASHRGQGCGRRGGPGARLCLISRPRALIPRQTLAFCRQKVRSAKSSPASEWLQTHFRATNRPFSFERHRYHFSSRGNGSRTDECVGADKPPVGQLGFKRHVHGWEPVTGEKCAGQHVEIRGLHAEEKEGSALGVYGKTCGCKSTEKRAGMPSDTF
ncbi:hypothetical protein SKAU_G00070480 [Synaphobranchus kaupii]|uniref:Uncharacterized protein n=1 Tax=Synaphobranchus kaupii TaxID=118154 RepID=A0A9Q1G7J5_SYNKA|nr:hypothetical protein SKAU_G00070480 [Synaphobranchus kaupii]